MDEKKLPLADEEAIFMKAQTDAFRLLSARSRSIAELDERLAKKNYSEATREKLITLLKKQGLLDDEKFAKLFANSRVYSRPQGKKNLVSELKKKGLSADLVQKTVDGLGEYEEKKIALDLVRTRFERMTGVPEIKKKTRIYGFLKRRGFEDAVIYEVIKELLKESHDLDNG